MKLILSFVVLLILLTGCIFSPNDSRINPYDPKSPYFELNFSNLQATAADRDKSIKVSWRNESEYTDGFIVWKKLDKNFKAVDTLRQSTFHIDSSGEYSLNLQYKVAPFYENNGKIQPQKAQVTPQIDYGSVTQHAVISSGNGLIIQWTNSSFFDDLTILEYKEANSNKWQELFSTEQRTDKNFREFFELSQQQKYDFKISLFLKNHKGKLQHFSEVEFSYNK